MNIDIVTARSKGIIRDQCEFIKPKPRVHNHHLTIQHWQLRDLLTCPRSSDEFIYISQNQVNSYNTRHRSTNQLIADLPFKPNSITSANGYLAVGGQKGQVMVRQLYGNWSTQLTVNANINNALCISKHLDGTRLLVCNNDQTIKIFSLPGMTRLPDITFPTAVNHVSVSPDGRKMVAVGDSKEVFRFDISPSGSYKLVDTYTTTSDASFSCAWNQSSDKFAVASQDGFVSVWDVRHSEKLCRIRSQQPQVKGAARCVKFTSSGSIDLLLFSEHSSYVHLVDARTFTDRQVIRVGSPVVEEHISGLAVSPDSTTCFVGLEHSVLEFDVDILKRRCFPIGSML